MRECQLEDVSEPQESQLVRHTSRLESQGSSCTGMSILPRISHHSPAPVPGEAHELKSRRDVHQYPGSIRPSRYPVTGHADTRNSLLLPVASSTSAPAPALFRTRQTTLPFTHRHHRQVTDDEGPPARLIPVSATVPFALQQGGGGPRPHELRRTCPPPHQESGSSPPPTRRPLVHALCVKLSPTPYRPIAKLTACWGQTNKAESRVSGRH